MKKLLVLLFLILSLASFTTSEPRRADVAVQLENLDCHHGQCQATAKSTGKQCKHCVSSNGDLYCYQHKP
jgi:hypothetical protein